MTFDLWWTWYFPSPRPVSNWNLEQTLVSPGIFPIFQKMSRQSIKYILVIFLSCPLIQKTNEMVLKDPKLFVLCTRHCMRKYAQEMICLHNVIIDGRISHVHLPLAQSIHHSAADSTPYLGYNFVRFWILLRVYVDLSLYITCNWMIIIIHWRCDKQICPCLYM